MVEETHLRDELSNISKQMDGINTVRDALNELLKYTAKGLTSTVFDEDLFKMHVDHIVVYRKEEIGFSMKCGAVFRERIE